MGKKCFLLLIDSGIVVKKLLLVKGYNVIGRADDADLIISSKDISRHHAAVNYDGADFIIKDLNSTNGTFVNNRKIVKYNLQAGDEISIGDYSIFFDDGSGSFSYPEETEISRKGQETVIIDNKFTKLKQKLKDEKLKAEFGRIIGVVKKSRKRLSSLANEDKLTGLHNRQYFDKISRTEFIEAKERDSKLSILFIDIDHFKSVNDTYGHKKGDDALKIIAQLICASCRKSDFVARYGGEEIVVILPNTTSRDAVSVAQEINNIVAKQTKKILGIKITVSIGVATYPDDGTTLKGLLERADKALYQAKKSGRNRVCKFDEARD
jgi:diguanylate cyclase (GGDEF)-like protein